MVIENILECWRKKIIAKEEMKIIKVGILMAEKEQKNVLQVKGLYGLVLKCQI